MRPTLFHVADRYGISPQDVKLAWSFIRTGRPADKTLAPNGEPYLFRWHVVTQSDVGNVFFHIQVQSDPERPLHDHPWDNQSVILVGGYTEILCILPRWEPGYDSQRMFHERRAGDVVHRKAEWPHRLLLPDRIPYTMTLFTTGPRRRDWGFWYPDGWVNADKVTYLDGAVSKHIEKKDKQ